MVTPDWVQLGAAMLSGSALPWLAGFVRRRLIRDPKGAAEARKLNAEASHTEWGTLRDEIVRLQDREDARDRRIAELERLDHDREEREAALKRENKRLRTKVKRLEDRIRGLEDVFKLGPPTPEQEALLEQLKDVE